MANDGVFVIAAARVEECVVGKECKFGVWSRKNVVDVDRVQ